MFNAVGNVTEATTCWPLSGRRASVTCVARAEGVPAFTMNQLAAFVAVAEAGTLSGAAERLHVSASALSAAVTELERALQTQLLHRRKAKGVTLTPAGELVLPRARHLLYQARRARGGCAR